MIGVDIMDSKSKTIYQLKGKNIVVNVLENGNVHSIVDGNTMINTYLGNTLDNNINNIFILIDEENESYFDTLINKNNLSSVSIGEAIHYFGKVKDVEYDIIFSVIDDTFIYTVNLKPLKKGLKVKLFYGMDVSINDRGCVLSNEAYTSQYIDHKSFVTDLGYVVCSRQNQGRHSYLELGCLEGAVGYSTDGFSFFDSNYKLTKVPKAIVKRHLDNVVYQYEFSYISLETKDIELNDITTYHFYGSYLKEHNDQIIKPLLTDVVKEIVKNITFDDSTKLKFSLNNKTTIGFDKTYPVKLLDSNELNKFYPNISFEEYNDNKELISFFNENKSHCVIPLKEKIMERPSANLLISLNKDNINKTFDFEKVLATTTYIYGVFNSQITFGNTSFNKLMSNTRNPLNLQRITGQRIFIYLNNQYFLLDMPSIFEMGLNYSKWIYKLDDDYLIVETIMSTNNSSLKLHVKSLNNKQYKLLLTNHITMGQTEDESKFSYELDKNCINFKFDPASMCGMKYPEYSFKMLVDKNFILTDDSTFYLDEKSRGENLVVLSFSDVDELNITIGGTVDGVLKEVEENEKELYLNELTDMLNHLKLDTDNKLLDSYNILFYWFLHDALIHYISPHGLEQYNGAAWGTRDVCQGPLELFLGLQKYDEVKHIIRTVFSRQFIDDYTFPQWFMFDRYSNICDSSSHGDVIFWPLRMVGMYLEQTDDYSLLEEKIPYFKRPNMERVGCDTLMNHLKNTVKSIEENFIEGTYLSCYGGGDWDDTLQPANPRFKKEMVSGWTPELAYESFKLLEKVLTKYDLEFSRHLKEVAEGIKLDYHKYMIKDNVPVGFLHFENGERKNIIHPSDTSTNINYRLLPLTRGGISGILDDTEIKNAYNIIHEHLLFPDGVRLMDKSIKYKGGINTYFQRAETASNFGREIGLQYCHAHIRYCEFLHKHGYKEELLNEFLKINPIVIKDVVKNAMYRQRNSYFSSSDGAFLNRYEVEKDFGKLKDGTIGVKGGWRIYSSGSGIYLYNFISGLLGIKVIDNELTLKPQLPSNIDKLTIDYNVFGKDIKFIIKNNAKEIKIKKNSEDTTFDLIDGRIILKEEINQKDTIEIYCLGSKDE